jgi:class 3 adenylate cyclase
MVIRGDRRKIALARRSGAARLGTGVMASEETQTVHRRLAAIVVADVVGYARHVERDEGGTLGRLKQIMRELIKPVLGRHGGRIAELQGDGAVLEFGSVVAAVEASVEAQLAVTRDQASLPDERRIRYRVGVNLGDVVVEGEATHGDGVNIAARLQALCEPGGVLVSGWAHDHLRGKTDVPLRFVGTRRLKNIDRPVRVYEWRPEQRRPTGPPPSGRNRPGACGSPQRCCGPGRAASPGSGRMTAARTGGTRPCRTSRPSRCCPSPTPAATRARTS